jgi:hypothetical protein
MNISNETKKKEMLIMKTTKTLKEVSKYTVYCTPGFCEKVYSNAKTEKEAIKEAKNMAWQATEFKVIENK